MKSKLIAAILVVPAIGFFLTSCETQEEEVIGADPVEEGVVEE